MCGVCASGWRRFRRRDDSAAVSGAGAEDVSPSACADQTSAQTAREDAGYDNMLRFEQYEIWLQNGEHWELYAWFPEFEVATAVAHSRARRVRLVHAVFEDGKRVQEEILADLGATRENP